MSKGCAAWRIRIANVLCVMTLISDTPRLIDDFSIVPSVASARRSAPEPAQDQPGAAAPVNHKIPSYQKRQILSPNQAAISAAIDTMLERAGINKAELARRLGCSRAAVSQQTLGSKSQTPGPDGKVRFMRRKPSVDYFCRVAAVCGARLILEYSDRTEKTVEI